MILINIKKQIMVQTVCENHEWVEVTQTTTSGNNFTFTTCRKCGLLKAEIQNVSPKNELPCGKGQNIA